MIELTLQSGEPVLIDRRHIAAVVGIQTGGCMVVGSGWTALIAESPGDVAERLRSHDIATPPATPTATADDRPAELPPAERRRLTWEHFAKEWNCEWEPSKRAALRLIMDNIERMHVEAMAESDSPELVPESETND